MNILREQALQYVGHCLDDSGNVHYPYKNNPIPANAVLVGWQCGFEPLFVAVWSYLPDTLLDQDEAVDIAVDYLQEIGWFGDAAKQDSNFRLGANDPIEPDYIIGGRI
jgi:hypothetical protein